MDRRRFLLTSLAGALAVPLAAGAQQAGKVARIGYLSTGSATANPGFRKAFTDGLREHGWIEDKNILIEYRWEGAGRLTLDALAAELVRRPLDVILAVNTPAALATKRTGTMLPVVFATVSEPVAIGLVDSLPRPGKNFTGLTTINRELMAKRLEILKETIPGLTRVGYLANPGYEVPSELKSPLLVALLDGAALESVLVFTRTKHRANRLAEALERRGFAVARIHGNRSQAQRTAALAGFKAGTYRVLVATDIAARGIDVTGISHVVNFDVPNVPEDYIHRVGRTARAEATGDAITLVCAGGREERRRGGGRGWGAENGRSVNWAFIPPMLPHRRPPATDRRRAAQERRLAPRGRARADHRKLLAVRHHAVGLHQPIATLRPARLAHG